MPESGQGRPTRPSARKAALGLVVAGVARQPDGRIVIGGTVDDGNLWAPFLMRLKAL